MTERKPKEDGRNTRLRAALRENLKRRKTQARRRAGADAERQDQAHDSAGFVQDKPKG